MLHQTKTTRPFLCIELLQSFSKKELQKFHQFINSPYFNTDAKLIMLYKVLQKQVLDNNFTDELQSTIYAKVFDAKPGKALSKIEKKALRTKLSKLNQLAHHFLVAENLNKNQNVFNDILYSTLLRKKQFSAFQLLIKRDRKRLSNKLRKENIDYQHSHKLEMHYLDYLFLNDLVYKKLDYHIDEIIIKLDIQYFIKKLSLYIDLLSDECLVKNNEILIELKEVQQRFELPQYQNQPYLRVLFGTVSFLTNSNQTNLQHLSELLKQYNEKIPLIELIGLHNILLNFYSREIKKGNLAYQKDLIELYLSMDKQNLLLEDGIMPGIKLKNIVGRMCKNKYFDKALYFIEKYIPLVKKENQKSIQEICLAGLNFYKKNYEKALEHIIQVGNVNVTLEVNYRLLMMKIYYEREKAFSEKTERYYRSAEKFFNDNKSLSTVIKKSYKNFTQILINLYRFKHNEGKMTLAKLQQKLEQQEYNADRKWLLEKIEELKN